MATSRGQSSSRSTATGTYPSNKQTTTVSRPFTGRSRPRTAATTTGVGENEIICSICESRGISPTIGLSFVNLSTSEAVLCQFTDTQTYARTCHKIKVFSPSEIIHMKTAADSKLFSIIRENLEVDKFEILMTGIDRRYWSDRTGYEYVQQLAFPEDLESLKVTIGGNYFAACCFAAALKYIDLRLCRAFAARSLRIKFEPSEGSMMIDLSTITSLELIQNLQNAKSKDCLFGLLNETLTPMGSRFLRSNILQPSTDTAKLEERFCALEELSTKEAMFGAVRDALKSFIDTDRVLASLVVIPTKANFQYAEQCINNVLMLKAFVDSIKPLWQALAGVGSGELQKIRQLCAPENYTRIAQIITDTLNEDVTYSTQPIDLRSQRVYSVKAGVNGFLDVARQTYKEANEDAFNLVANLNQEHDLALDLRFESARQYYIRIPVSGLEYKQLPAIYINRFRKKNMIECQTLELVKLNQKITDAHNEVVNMSDRSIQDLIDDVRLEIHPLFKIGESVAMLDMIASFAQLVTTRDYVKPELTDTLAIKAGRHPIRDKIQFEKYVPNDVYATQQTRFQIITGCNMSGKSTYIRSTALMTVMAQIGCFVPAQYASFPISHQLFARVSTDDHIEANVSTFAAEMREIAFILRNIERRSLVIIDELGRGTSTTDGLAIAIAIAEALIESRAYVWFVTHFRDLARILAERAGVVNLHLAVDISANSSKMKMLYKISDGYEEEKFYGLALARVVDLPEEVITTATKVSKALHRRNEARKSNTKALSIARRRKLILSLREQLIHAKNGSMEGEELRQWLKRLQDEFVVRMQAIEAEAAAAAAPVNECEDTTEWEQDFESDAFGDQEEQLDQLSADHGMSVSPAAGGTRVSFATPQRPIKMERQSSIADSVDEGQSSMAESVAERESPITEWAADSQES